MGNTNTLYKNSLMKARPSVEKAYERIVCFKYELDRNRVTDGDKEAVKKVTKEAHQVLQDVLKAPQLNIPAKEREGIRGIKTQIAGLRGCVEDYEIAQNTAGATGSTADATWNPTADATRNPTADATRNPTADATRNPTADATRNPTADATRNPTADATRNPTADATRNPTADATRMLAQKVGNVLDNMREFLRWMDQKLEKRWWFKELIRYTKGLLLIATFLSATMAVAFPEFGGPIVTLALTVANGVLEIVEQTVTKGQSPKRSGSDKLQSASQRISPSA